MRVVSDEKNSPTDPRASAVTSRMTKAIPTSVSLTPPKRKAMLCTGTAASSNSST